MLSNNYKQTVAKLEMKLTISNHRVTLPLCFKNGIIEVTVSVDNIRKHFATMSDNGAPRNPADLFNILVWVKP